MTKDFFQIRWQRIPSSWKRGDYQFLLGNVFTRRGVTNTYVSIYAFFLYLKFCGHILINIYCKFMPTCPHINNNIHGRHYFVNYFFYLHLFLWALFFKANRHDFWQQNKQISNQFLGKKFGNFAYFLNIILINFFFLFFCFFFMKK